MSELFKALARARMACKAVLRKEGNNTAQGYKYVGYEHVLVSGAREALLTNGLLLLQTSTEFAGEVIIQRDKAGPLVVLRWRGRFLLVHESGDKMEYTFEATTGMNDKSAFIASTALDRTAMLRICQMSGGAKEDAEHDENDRYQESFERSNRAKVTLDDIANGGKREEMPQANAPDNGKLRDDLVTRYNTAAKAAAEFGQLELSGECDEHGLMIPPMPMSVFGGNTRHAGRPYDDPKLVGVVRQMANSDSFKSSAPMLKQVHAAYVVTRHELGKLAP